MLNQYVDVEYFNKLLTKQGGKALKTSKKEVIMHEFINKLIKTFRKDFMKKTKKGGTAELYNLDGSSDISYSLRFGDLLFDTFTFPPLMQVERDLL